MSDKPSQPLLSESRVTEMAEWVKLPVEAIQGNPYFANFCIRDLLEERAALLEEIAVRRRYGHFCCTAHADAALAEKRATGMGPWEDTRIATLNPPPAPAA